MPELGVPDSGRRAILISVCEHDDPRVDPLPAAANSVRAMTEVLADPRLCGWPADSLRPYPNPVHSDQFADTLEHAAAEADDVLLIYFVGHGRLTDEGQLYLTLKDTRSRNTGLDYETIRRAVLGSAAKVKIVVLDCCFAGRAIESLGADVADSTATKGAYILTASHGAGTAHVPPLPEQAAACTSFTGQLVQLIRDGVPGGPPELSLDELYPQLRHALGAQDLPKPNKRCDGDAGEYPFTRNAFSPSADTDAAVTLTEGEWTRLMRARELGEMIRSRRARVRERAMVELARMRNDPCEIVATQVAVFLDEVGPRWRLMDLPARLAGPVARVRAARSSWQRPRGRVVLPVLSVVTALALLGGYLMWHHSSSAVANTVPGVGDAVLWQRTLTDSAHGQPAQCVGVTDGRSELAFNTPSATVRALLAGVAGSNAREAARPAGATVTIVVAAALGGAGWGCADPVPQVAPTAVPACAPAAAGAGPIANDQYALSFPSDIPSGLDQLRGALTAICAEEADPTQPADRPRIHLLVANVGAGFAFADRVIQAVVAARASSGVIGVIGLNQSQPMTDTAIQALDGAGVAAVGSTIGADDYTTPRPDGSRRYPNFFRIGTTNAREVSVLYRFMTASPSGATAGDSTLSGALHRPNVCLVMPTGNDTYSVNLSRDLLAHGQASVFAYTVDSSGAVRQAPTPTGRQPCRPDTFDPGTSAFFFAGRVKNLRGVLGLLHAFPAQIPIIGGDDPGQLGALSAGGTDRDMYYAEGGFSFSFTDHSSDGALAQYRDRGAFGFAPFLAAGPPVFGQASVTPKAMVAFDALWALLHAVNAVSRATPDLARSPAAASTALIAQLDGTCGTAALRGATGLTSFDSYGDRTASLIVMHKLEAATGRVTGGYVSGVPSTSVLRENMRAGRYPPSCVPPAG